MINTTAPSPTPTPPCSICGQPADYEIIISMWKRSYGNLTGAWFSRRDEVSPYLCNACAWVNEEQKTGWGFATKHPYSKQWDHEGVTKYRLLGKGRSRTFVQPVRPPDAKQKRLVPGVDSAESAQA